jgi:hypothetical protein
VDQLPALHTTLQTAGALFAFNPEMIKVAFASLFIMPVPAGWRFVVSGSTCPS